jgi:putative tricarboxylic transport membrane protein
MVVDSLIQALSTIFQPLTLLLLTLSILSGIIIGAIPGLGPVVGMTVILPVTLLVDPSLALVILTGIYAGSMYGGSIPAILINTPGTASAVATTIDGYPMSRAGQAMMAISLATMSSTLGGTMGFLTIILITPFMIEFLLLFGSPEYFLMTILGISLIGYISTGPLLKAVIAGAFGLSITTIGVAPTASDVRFTFEILSLYSGIHYVATILGLFAIAEMMKLSIKKGSISEEEFELEGNIISGIKQALSHPIAIIKGGIIGMGIGALPGAGASVATFVSYGEASSSKKEGDEEFGEGNPLGVISVESANNAAVGGSLVPTLAFGIPGSAASAIVLGGLIMHGVIPGPELFSSDLDITYTLLIALLLGNVVILVTGLSAISYLGIVTKIDTDYIIPVVIVLALLGVLLIRENFIDVIAVFVFATIGYYMIRYGYSPIAFVLGVVLGPIMESNLHRSVQLTDRIYMLFFNSYVSILITLVILLTVIGPTISSKFNNKLTGSG